mgnify:CR=1 FL=1
MSVILLKISVSDKLDNAPAHAGARDSFRAKIKDKVPMHSTEAILEPAILFGQGEVLFLLVVTIILVFIVTRRR